jgi:hypothetical protein
MKWTWEEFQNQPAWFIDILIEMLKAEGETINKKAQEKNY